MLFSLLFSLLVYVDEDGSNISYVEQKTSFKTCYFIWKHAMRLWTCVSLIQLVSMYVTEYCKDTRVVTSSNQMLTNHISP